MPHNFIIILFHFFGGENDAPLMARGNINFTHTHLHPVVPSLSFSVAVPFRQCRGEGQSEAGGGVLQEDPESRQPGGEGI